MNGVGPTPQDSIYQNYYAIYTAPDPMTNNLYFWTLKGTHELTDKLKIGGNGYYRNNTTTNVNSNANNNCTGGYSGNPSSCTTALDAPQPGITTTPAEFLSSNLIQNGLGVNLQLTSDYEIFDAENQFVTGGGFNYGHTNYSQGMNNAVFNPVPYMTGVTPYYPTAVVSGSNAYTNLFATDTLSPLSWLHLNASLNWIQAQINTYDNTPTPDSGFDWGGNNPPTPGALASSNIYTRVNPSAGFTLQPFDALEIDTPFKDFTTYFSYNEGFRAPTAMEQACADPNAPCSLPNVMVSDPALLPVITKTLELGARSKLTEEVKWNAALYQSRSHNDIQYIQAPQNSNVQGYFSNVGITQRMGAEFGVSGISFEKLNWYMSYGFVSATYQSNMTLADPTGNNVSGVNVTPGNRLPMIPQNTIKFGSEYELYKGLFIGGDLQYVGTQFARGDYANQYGELPSYTVLNLNAKYFLTKEFELFVMGRNITNQQYYSYGQMGQNFFAGNSATTFLGPGAPATVYGGLRFHWE
jgi:outer membrane receptor protein involved in Fe transport